MKLRQHVIISVVSGGAVYAVTRSPVFTVSAVLSGIFIDLDHFIDYFLNFGFRVDVKDFFEKCDGYQLKRFYVILHSYELIFLLVILNLFFYSTLLAGILFGFSLHLIADCFSNNIHPLGYSFLYRLSKKFNCDELFTQPNGHAKTS